VHAIGYVGCVREPRFFDLWIIKLSRCPRVKTFWFWQANVYQP
jgi:type IV secretion system protein VirB3